ncbi:PhoX family protein [Salinisphaera sp.]|uniref:PhoX family protein n=1 Tax=Salinisphaera sp. TaxID=1914330 RepID=UPI002D798EB6|nr:PhoX family phosphatase [Salinisphaera sp.]HET7315212.1 PhoX family phosphatase [Salinisphaera sp.]
MTDNRPPFRLPTYKIDEEQAKTDEPIRSTSAAPSMGDMLAARVSRRATLRGGLGLAALTIFAGAGLAGCDDNNDNAGGDNAGDDIDSGASGGQSKLTFDSIPHSTADEVRLPDGYRYQTLLAWGTPILSSAAAFDPATNTAEDQAGQTGMHHDGMFLFSQSDDMNAGILAINHENITAAFLHPEGRAEDADGKPTDIAQVRKEMAAHGVSIVEISQDQNGVWRHGLDGRNRRITANTPITMSGPAAGSEYLVTPYSAQGTRTRGTLNNCGRGYTPWGTYLTCEENIQGYFATADPDPGMDKTRYGIGNGGSKFWDNVAGQAGDDAGRFARFDVTASGNGPNDDWRNESNTFGWVVEIDPNDPSSEPKKRTAMGRFRHEGAQPSPIVDGRPIAFYMGDDARGEYCYKFVTADAYIAGQPMPDMLDRGTLYAARFDDDGTGEWLALDVVANDKLAQAFDSQAHLLVNTRTAADIVGATPMDRPEWSAVDPSNGEIYYTLTNNSDRGAKGEEQVDAANPRVDNTYGHIIRQTEADADPAAVTFTWDIFVFGAPAAAGDDLNRSGLTAANDFGSPDGLWFDRRGVLWIQTDNGGNKVSQATNNQMLAVIPADLSDDRVIRAGNQASLKRFLVGPKGCEITGSELSADARTLFANVQHPSGTFPDGHTPARSTTLAIRRNDGKEIAI